MAEELKKAAIVVDNYKIKKYSKALKKAGYEFTTIPFHKDTTAFSVMVAQKDVPKMTEMLRLLELEIHRGN